jgi:hypothetical protein
MADSKLVKLSAERWMVLSARVCALDPSTTPTGLIIVAHPVEIDGILFLPARYIGPEEADPVPAEPPIKPKPAPAYLGA